ncbi:zinc-binding dehydrogenase [Agrobacterium pusense]|uniref:zinc-binding dehydrogenase n=1 Tax=Agrobacterium pusense TaxID=648995 RepID=UPI00345E3575
MTRFIQMQSAGGPSVLQVIEKDLHAPRAGEVRLIQDAIGLNFVDTMIRKGRYPMALPAVPGFEAAGTISEVGSGVEGLSVGDRVAYFFSEGAYATERIIPTAPLIRLPADISNETAATFLAKGATAWMGMRGLHDLKSAETVLVLGASGSVGAILSRWAKSLGAMVIGVAGSRNKFDRVAAGSTHAFHAGEPDIAAKIRAIAPHGVDIVYDLVGRATFALGASSVRDGGVIAAIGAATGQPAPAPDLVRRGVAVRSGGTPQYVRGRAVETATSELWDALRSGIFDDLETIRYQFDEIARAHDDMDNRRLSGLPVLIA